jgi:type IV secretory pathway TrbD component
MNEPEQTIMRTSLSRPQQLLGGDREMVIMAGLGAAMMAVSVMTFVSFVLAIVGFWTIVIVLARIGKALQGFLLRQERSHRLWQDAEAGMEVESVWRDAETADWIGGLAPVVWAGR